jgi:hypothetical protein
MPAQDAFYGRWVFANTWSEALGLGATFVGGSLAAPLMARSDTLAVLLCAFLAIFLGTVVEGVLVGIAQERVLAGRLREIPRGAWVAATAVGAGLAWALGMIPSTLLALMDTGATDGPMVEPGPLVQYSLAAGLGLVAGPILAAAQWTVLRRYTAHAGRWLWANAAAWAVGMPLIFLGMDRVPWNGPAPITYLAIYLVCAAAGLVVGAIHGMVLRQLVKER